MGKGSRAEQGHRSDTSSSQTSSPLRQQQDAESGNSKENPKNAPESDYSDENDVEMVPVKTLNENLDLEIEDDYDADAARCFGIKYSNLSRLFKVVLAFPFVVIVSTVKPSGRYAWMRSISIIRIMNVMIYIIPFVVTNLVLSEYLEPMLQIAVIAGYMFLYLLPVAFVVFSKIDIIKTSTNIEEGTFCFKPARTVRFTEANFYQLLGFLFEWIQHVLYVLPVGVVAGTKQAKIADYPPYLPFAVYFWLCVSGVFLCSLIVILNAVLRGRRHYKFQKSGWIWYILFNLGQPMFNTILTILFMGLWCDYTVEPAVTIQDPEVICYGDEHSRMVRAGLIALALYVVQHTLLPSGTFKETMGDDTLEIMFVPIYMSAHLLLKTVFCGVYVFFYTNNMLRIWVLTVINFMMLWINNSMQPCSIGWVNVLRSTMFLHACLSGIQSINYVFWPIGDSSSNNVLVSTLASNITFTSVAMWALYYYNSRGTEHSIAIAFLDLEWQVSHGGTVYPRVLEPLISLTLSKERADWEIVKNYIEKLIWLISHKYRRVQFQAAWTIANLALLDEDARIKIHNHGGTRTLLEWYNEMDDPVQLESLAALANLSLSYEVTEAMVLKHKCIPFFLQIISGSKIKHAHFAMVSLGNIARVEEFRDMIVLAGGMHVLVGCIMSHDYLKLKFASLGLANLILNVSADIEEAMNVKGAIERVIKIAARGEAETQVEVMALLRNLAFHSSMREQLLNKGILKVCARVKESPFEKVVEWVKEIEEAMGAHVDSRPAMEEEETHHESTWAERVQENESSDLYEKLKKMAPLEGRVEWSTWGSKLDTIFAPVFAGTPDIGSQHVHGLAGVPMPILLPAGVPPALLQAWKGNIRYVIINKPIHGTLSEYSTTNDFITYHADKDFVGTDFFVFRGEMGSLRTAPTCVTISVGGSDGGGALATVTKGSPPPAATLTNRKVGGNSFPANDVSFGKGISTQSSSETDSIDREYGLESFDTNQGGGRTKRYSAFSMDMTTAMGGSSTTNAKETLSPAVPDNLMHTESTFSHSNPLAAMKSKHSSKKKDKLEVPSVATSRPQPELDFVPAPSQAPQTKSVTPAVAPPAPAAPQAKPAAPPAPQAKPAAPPAPQAKPAAPPAPQAKPAAPPAPQAKPAAPPAAAPGPPPRAAPTKGQPAPPPSSGTNSNAKMRENLL